MKQTPLEQKIALRMKPGVITLNGFIGDDTRHFNEIIEDDERTLAQLDRTPEEIAERMQYFTDKSWDSFDEEIVLEEIYKVETDVTRGRLSCPFSHPGAYRKATTVLTNTKLGITVCWSTLNIHMIQAHHFFEGKGASFRLEPQLLVKVLF